jgi:hypothetical protein
MSPQIPAPELIGEPIEGAVYSLPGGEVLVVGAVPAALADYQPVMRGSLFVRYALPLLDPPDSAVIPGLFAAEKGGMLVGRAAWDYIQRQFQVHPRADVVGVDLQGNTAQVFLRELDLGAPVHVLIYDSPEAVAPAVEVTALLKGDNPLPLPDLLAQYLPVTDLHELLDGPDAQQRPTC